MTSTLYRHGVVHSAADPFAEAILVDGDTIAWLGADDTADGLVGAADEVIDLDGAIVTPGFVDSHVHLLGAYHALTGGPVPGEGGRTHGTAPTDHDPLTSAERLVAYRQVLTFAAEHGVVAVHEMSTPGTDTREGLAAVLALTADPDSRLPLVVGYRGELCVTADDAAELAAQIPGLTGIGGDLAVDGYLDDRTARLRTAYQDAPGQLGRLELSAEQIANHVGAVTRAGLQAGFHVVGDAALDEVLLGIRAAADVEGLASVAGAGHRLEHVEMVDASALATLAVLGLRVSAQPAVARAHGGPRGIDVDRLGPSRSTGLQPFADLAQVGVPLAFGSDAPHGPLDPWRWVAAAFLHHQQGQRISARAAFRAATRGGWRLAGLDHTGAGELRVGAPAHLAVWRADELVVEAVDGRFTSWSTDARAGTPLLPSVSPDAAPPVCLRTVRAGLPLYDRFG